MSFLTGLAERLANHYQSGTIEEDCLFMKAVSYIPLLGVFSSLTQELSLKRKIENETNLKWTIRLLNVKNQYIAAGTVRSLLNVVLCIVIIALDIIQGWIWIVYTAVFAGLASREIYRLVNNTQVIDALQSNGAKEGMWIS